MTIFSQKKGIAALIVALAVSLFLFSISVLVATEGNSTIFTGQFESIGNRAQYLAQAGIEDAALKLARDSTYRGSYTIEENDGVVQIHVASTTPITVNVTSTVSQSGENAIRTIQAQITIDADGKISAKTVVNQ